MIYIINPHEAPIHAELDRFADDCKADDGWIHNMIGVGDAELIRDFPHPFDEILARKVQEAINELKERLVTEGIGTDTQESHT